AGIAEHDAVVLDCDLRLDPAPVEPPLAGWVEAMLADQVPGESVRLRHIGQVLLELGLVVALASSRHDSLQASTAARASEARSASGKSRAIATRDTARRVGGRSPDSSRETVAWLRPARSARSIWD